MTESIPGSGRQTTWQVFVVFLRLGLTSFGGPIAHLGYFRDAFVAAGWTRRPTATWSRCASSCPVPRRARSVSGLAWPRRACPG